MTRNASTQPSSTEIAAEFRSHFGMLLQQQRGRLGLTQAKLAERANLSMKYVGEIERGEANTSLDVINRLAIALSWSPLNGLREPMTEGLRVMLITEAERLVGRLETMVMWLRAIDAQPSDQTERRPRGRPRRKAGTPAPI